MARSQKLVGVLAVDWLAVGLAVGRMGAVVGNLPTNTNSFVGRNSAPSQGINDVLLGAGHKTSLVGVFDAEQKITT
jgi:hypothetical protein